MNLSPGEIKLHIPEGINYECTGCGTCCSGWSVPLTEADYNRISPIDWTARLAKFNGKFLFRPLKKAEAAGTPYTHAIRHGEDGHCPFLVNNLCFIHSQFEAATKPAICQLFPYCFNETPSGVYATVSFVSMGVVYNSGKALAEQRDLLNAKLAQFQSLFPDHHPNWSKLQLTVGQPLEWPDYLALEEKLLDCLKDRSKPLANRFMSSSDYLLSVVQPLAASNEPIRIRNDSNPPKPPNHLDKALLIALHKVYFPTKPTGKGQGDFSLIDFCWQATGGSICPGLTIQLPGKSYKIDDLLSTEIRRGTEGHGGAFGRFTGSSSSLQINWPDSDPEIEDLLYRYFYSRIFAKLYFGAGFGQLSLIAGFHHLALLLSLIKLQAKVIALSRDAKVVSLIDVVTTIRQLEKRLGEATLGPYAAATLELLLYSPRRLRRILNIC